jgi:predicted AAA+ superfamily ATPase
MGSQFWFYRTHAGAEIDLLIERGGQRIGYEFKCASSVGRSDASGLKAGLTDGIITEGAVVYFGQRRYPLDNRIEALPAENLLMEDSEPLHPSA